MNFREKSWEYDSRYEQGPKKKPTHCIGEVGDAVDNQNQ